MDRAALPDPPPAGPDAEALRAAVDIAARRYFDARRVRIESFVAAHFSLRGSARLHRRALGWDALRAPANLVLAPVNLALRASAGVARAAGARETAERLAASRVLLDTDVAREVRRLILAELFELPTADDPAHDALAAAIAEAPEVRAALPGAAAARLGRTLADYAETRAAVADMTTSLVALGAGAAALQKLTPGMLTLGPAAATAMAHAAAVSAFPLGATAGGVWYALFPVAASPALAVGVTAGAVALGAAAAAFAGVLADPIQAAFGIHQRRLRRLVDAAEAQFLGEAEDGFPAREHYLARLLDIADAAAMAARGLAP